MLYSISPAGDRRIILVYPDYDLVPVTAQLISPELNPRISSHRVARLASLSQKIKRFHTF